MSLSDFIINLRNLRDLSDFDIGQISENPALVKIFNIFDKNNTDGYEGSDGVLNGAELNSVFESIATAAANFGEIDSFDIDDANYYVENTKTQSGKTLSEEGVTAKDVINFLNKLITNGKSEMQAVTEYDTTPRNVPDDIPSGIIKNFYDKFGKNISFKFSPETNWTIIKDNDGNYLGSIEPFDKGFNYDIYENNFLTAYCTYNKFTNKTDRFYKIDYEEFLNYATERDKNHKSIDSKTLSVYLKADSEFAINLMSDLANLDDNGKFDEDTINMLYGLKVNMSLDHSSKTQGLLKKIIAQEAEQNNHKDLLKLINKTKVYDDIFFIANIIHQRFSYESTNLKNVDGILYNEKTKQGPLGNCGYLAFLLAGSENNEFNKLFSEFLTKIDEKKQTYTLSVNGKEYKYTYDEIKNSTECSTGDMTIRVLEMAARDEMLSELSGCDLCKATEFLCGDSGICKTYEKYDIAENLETIIKHAEEKTHIMTVGISHDDTKHAINTKTGKKVKIESNHAYAVVGATKRFLFIKNPWNSSETLKLDINDFKNGFDCEEVETSVLIEKIKQTNGIKTSDTNA